MSNSEAPYEEIEQGFPWSMVAFGALSALAVMLMWQIVTITGGAATASTIVFNSPATGTRIVAVLSNEVIKELNHDARNEVHIKDAAPADASAATNDTTTVSAYQSFENAQDVLVTVLAQLVETLTAQQGTSTEECVSHSIGGPWDNPGWVGDQPGCDDPTPGVTKMFWAPIQGAGGEGGGSSSASSSGSSGDSGGSVGGGAPSGGPPSGGPGAGPSF